MEPKELTINSIWGGQSASRYFSREGEYESAIAIDPDLPILSTDVRTSGFIVPVGSSDFTGTNVNDEPIAIINNPKNTLTYIVLANGRLISYNSSLASETLIASTFTVTIASPAIFSLTAHGLAANDVVYFSTTGALPTGLTAGTTYYVISAGLTADAFEVSTSEGGAAVNTSGTQSGTHSITMACKGALYYNNYIYLMTGTNVSRYGPLNNSPALAHNIWKGTTLGSLTALTNTTYPALRSVTIPNHAGHVHGDGSAYFCDFLNGQGYIHRINTRRVTDEGDTNGTTVASAYNVLDLPFGFYPTDIESYGTSLFITGIFTVDTTINQGKSAFILWDPTDTTSFYLGPVPLPDPLCTAALNSNGRVYLWTGNASNGVRLSKYLGGESIEEIVYQEEGMPPFSGAVDALGNRIVWGGYTTNPEVHAVVWAWGSKDARLPKGLHCVMQIATATTPIVSALKYVEQSSNITPKLVVGWNHSTDSGVDKYSTTATLDSSMRRMFNIGKKFSITRISIPLAGAVAANTTISPSCYFDDLSVTKNLTVINNTNYASHRKVIYKGTELKDYIGQNNFLFELTFTGTNPLPVALPITFQIEVWEDEASA